MDSRWASSSGPGSITATTGPASTIQVLVPGPVYGPGLGATTRLTRVTGGGSQPVTRSATRRVSGAVDGCPGGRARVDPARDVGGGDQADLPLPHPRPGQ